MKKYMLFFILLLVFSNLFAGRIILCDVRDKTDKFSLEEQHETINVKAGKTFSISLDSNPSTGYHWELEKSIDTKLVKLQKSEYKAPETNMVGAGGKEIFVFKALKPGSTTIYLKYVRPWEKGIKPVKEKAFHITIN